MKKSLVAWVGTVALVGGFGGRSARASAEKADGPPTIAFALTYKTKIPAPPAGTKCLEAWIPVPFEDELQKVSALKVTASVPYALTKDAVYGNRMVHVVVADPKAEVTVDWSALVTRTEDDGQSGGFVLPRYCEPDALAPLEGEATKLAADLKVTDPATPVRTRARTIFDEVVSTMTYDKETPGWGSGDFHRAVTVGKGNCSDFAAKFIGITRAAGIPARWISSIALSSETAGCSACGYHCYAHFRDGDRWVPVDASEAQKALAKDRKHADWFFGHAEVTNVVLSVGRDLVLEPRQQGKPVNFFGGPYVELDGKPISVPSENRTFEYEAQ